MGFIVGRPSTALAPYIKQYWAVQNDVPSGEKFTQRIVPSGLPELSFYLGDMPMVSDEKKEISTVSSLSGQLKAFYDVTITGHLRLFSVQFHPFGLKSLFDLPVSELYDLSMPLRYLLNDNLESLEGQLMECISFHSKIQVIEKFIIARLSKIEKPYELNRIQHSIRIINHQRGKPDIHFLAAEACLSRKQYERTFNEYIGNTPRQFLRTVRFQNALFQRSQNARMSLTSLAYACGYYDQSHMVHDFKVLTGMTPKHFFEDCPPYSDYFA